MSKLGTPKTSVAQKFKTPTEHSTAIWPEMSRWNNLTLRLNKHYLFKGMIMVMQHQIYKHHEVHLNMQVTSIKAFISHLQEAMRNATSEKKIQIYRNSHSEAYNIETLCEITSALIWSISTYTNHNIYIQYWNQRIPYSPCPQYIASMN